LDYNFPKMSLSSTGDACARLADDLEQHWSISEELNGVHRGLIARLTSLGDNGGNEKGRLWAYMPDLAAHVEQILLKGQPEEFKSAVITTLADLTREVPFWRPLFGLEDKPDSATHLSQITRRQGPDSILEVARRVVAGAFRFPSDAQTRAALRIIANSCADNNVNRSIIVNRDGIEHLLDLLANGRERDLVIPVLYNVCVDFDDRAVDGNGQPWRLAQMRGAEADTASPLTLSAAELRLGTYWFEHNGGRTVFDTLFDAGKQSQSATGTIADLVEMASRVALYGVEHFRQEKMMSDPTDVIEVDAAPDLVRRLLTDGVDLASEDTDCRVSICQAALNLLSQPETHATVVRSERLLQNLISLPYATQDGDDPDEEAEAEATLAPYRKEVLRLVYTISATEEYAQTFQPGTNSISACVQILEQSVDQSSSTPLPRASICVLVANSITTTDRARTLLETTPITQIMVKLLSSVSDSEILLPALDLATRLALCAEGQDALCSASDQNNIFATIAKIIKDRTNSEVDATGLEIQRNAITLTRLLVKGRRATLQMLNLATLSEKDASTPVYVIHELYNLWHRTSDPQSKTELGRLMIEILRTLFSSPPSTTAESTLSVRDAESTFLDIFGTFDQSALPDHPSRATVVPDAIALILTQSTTHPPPQQPSPPQTQTQTQAPAPTRAAEAEAWFGLALLSTISSSHASIRTALGRDSLALLTRVSEIVRENTRIAAQDTAAVDRDPRYENIKVLVVKLLQADEPTAKATAGHRSDEDAIKKGLEAAAADMGLLEWVVV
jgi:hypothetical protein